MLEKLKQLFQNNQLNTEESAADELSNPMVKDGLDLTIERTAYYKKSIKKGVTCPKCQTTLQTTYSIFMVALRSEGDVIDAFAIGDTQIGHFCPQCPTVLLNMTAVEEQVTMMEGLPNQFGIQVLGLLDIDNTDQIEKGSSEYPIIPFRTPKSKTHPQKRKAHKPKRKR